MHVVFDESAWWRPHGSWRRWGGADGAAPCPAASDPMCMYCTHCFAFPMALNAQTSLG